MRDYVVLSAEDLVTSAGSEVVQSGPANGGSDADEEPKQGPKQVEAAKEECRICQEEDFVGNMISPCACNGSTKFVHMECIQHWVDVKKENRCEICYKAYQGVEYTGPPRGDTVLDVWVVNEQNAEEGEGEEEEEEEEDAAAAIHVWSRHLNAARTALLRSTLLTVMAVMLMSHVYTILDTTELDNDITRWFALVALRLLAILMPVHAAMYVLALLLRRAYLARQAGRVGVVGAFICVSLGELEVADVASETDQDIAQ